MSRLLLIAFQGNEAEQLSGFAHKLGLPFDVLAMDSNAALDLGADLVMQVGMTDVPPADGFAMMRYQRIVERTRSGRRENTREDRLREESAARSQAVQGRT